MSTKSMLGVNDRHRCRPMESVDATVTSLEVGPVNESSSTQATIEIDGKVHEVSFQTEAKQLLELRTVADWIIRPRLLKVPGVAEVFMQGGDRKQYQILLDPTALLEYDVTVQQVEQALRESNINTSGGFAITGETERPIRILGRLGTGSRDVWTTCVRSRWCDTPGGACFLNKSPELPKVQS